MRMYLSALGWITDAPEGNRLRWSYPLEGLAGEDKFLGLPEQIIVERAWLDEDIPYEYPRKPGSYAVSGTIPYNWWDEQGTVSVSGMPWAALNLGAPVQAVRFTYQGMPARVVVYDETDQVVTERLLNNGDFFYHEAPSMQRLVFLAFSVTLQDLGTVDLFDDHGLPFETIAVIRVAKTIQVSLDVAAPRYTIPPTMTETEWEEFIEFANQGMSSSPGSINPDDPSPWTTFQMAMGLRWEHAVLFGHGFVDGPHGEQSELDWVDMDLLLQQMPDRPVAYRVREREDRTKPSNLVVCPPLLAAPLGAPLTPTYIAPEVRLTEDPDTGEPFFEASLALRWQQTDPHALGVEVEEKISSSPSTGAAGSAEHYQSRTHRPEDPPMMGELARVFDVPFYDVTLRAQIRAVDGWDRVSAGSGWTPVTPLVLDHHPHAPALAAARWSGGTARLTRQVGDANFPDWQPDLVVKSASGAKVFVYRKDNTKQPAVASVSVSTPVPVAGGRYRATVSGGPPSLSPFVEGSLIVPPFKVAISSVSGNDVFFEAGDEGSGSTSLFGAGPATLQQDPRAVSLWQKVAEFPVNSLPVELTFSDGLPMPTQTADVLSYYTRVSFPGGLGPASNIVQAWRIPETPVEPPPFTVSLLGIDFYNRTLLKISLTTPAPGGKFTVWWASGTPSAAEFSHKAVPGEYRAQTAQEGRYLFDVLAIPIPQTVNRTITIGVQRVNDGGGQSKFAVVPIVLPAVAPSP